jgi:peptidyl-prolyl cis-trans isomerase B (cyclophilin B)
VSSIKDRQRAAARARLEKEMAERSTAARKRRQRQAVIGSALALVVVAAGTVWLVTALNKDDKPAGGGAVAGAPGTTSCVWNPDASGNPNLVDVGGTPPATVPNVGKGVMTITTNLGPIDVSLDLSKVPCTAANFEFLASKKFWDETKCHRLVNADKFKVLQCGDPKAKGKGYRETDGSGGPTYQYAEENMPKTAPQPAYPKGVIAMAKTENPSTTGSQFFMVFGDTELAPDYTILGTITKGLDIVEKVGAAGDDGAFKEQAGGGHPKTELLIKTLTVTKS